VTEFSIPRGDLLPILSATLSDAKGPIDLTGATVKFQMRLPGSSTLKVDAAAQTVDPATGGQVTYTWAGTDTDTPGLYIAWFLVTYSGKTMEAPNPQMVVEVGRGPG
jgi:hypothetical protein